jgi:type III secretory pathway component EscU
MKNKTLVSTLLYMALIGSVLLFFMAPSQEYLPKLVYIAILVVYGLAQYRRANMRAMVACGIGTAFLLLTLPGSRIVAGVEVFLILVGWVVAMHAFKKSKDSAS